jgi:hypothetical protein
VISECHAGVQPVSLIPKSSVKKSRAGIRHELGTPGYQQPIHFNARRRYHARHIIASCLIAPVSCLAFNARSGLNVGHEIPRLSPVNPLLPSDYGTTLKALQRRSRQARPRATLAANSALVLLYWEIGRTILERQTREGWGAKVVDRLARDLRRSFPDMQGLSPRNLQFMRSFAAEFPDAAIVKQLASQLP